MDNQALEAKAKEYIVWETHEGFSGEVKQLLEKQDWKELNERFYAELSFGTGGIRGIMGGGFNRMNTFMVQRASEGLARYMGKHAKRDREGRASICIAHDSRNNSSLFARDAAKVFVAHGIKVYLFPELRPTPQLSFAVRRLGCGAGIVLTASHNPKKYNGYKVYWNDGAQVVPPDDQGIIDEVRNVKGDIQRGDLSHAEQNGLLVWLGKDMDEAFLQMAEAQSLRPAVFKAASSFGIVYTPLHGTGLTLMKPLAERLGIKLSVVNEQAIPDGDFPTVVYPNPEEASALELSLRQARREGAGLVIGTDPDADRIGIAVKHGSEMVLLNGNQHGVLMVDYIFGTLKELGKLPPKPAFVNTIVTTALQRVIARAYGAEAFETLTGFKWIAAKMRELEQTRSHTYVMGDEESYGFLIGTEVRDKDAITASLLTIEMALYWQSKGKTLLDRLKEIFVEHGFYQEIQISKEFEGSEGLKKIQALMAYLRANCPQTLGSVPILEMKDISKGSTWGLKSKSWVKNIDLPVSDVLQFVLADGTIISARPSGTEPKIKFYASVGNAPSKDLVKAEAEVAAKIQGIRDDIESLVKKALS